MFQTRDGGNKTRDPIFVGEVFREMRGERGVGGTVGQRQRAAYARAQPYYAARLQVYVYIIGHIYIA